jgi:alpha-D-ribose 1-methylphosphonate 5-triphosphate synthase subunit PhnH
MDAIAPAFADPVAESQSVFRAVMNAMARPGSIQPLKTEIAPPEPLSRGQAAVALALADFETPMWLDEKLAAAPAVTDFLRFHTGAPIVADAAKAFFALIGDGAEVLPFERFAQGTMEYPDRSATLIVNVESFAGGQPLMLAGPGIAEVVAFSAWPQPVDFAACLAANRALFPRGVDLVFVAGDSVAALPRSVRVLRGA